MKKPKTPVPDMTVRTEKMVYGGQALARADRFVVFVDDALPGETVRVHPYKRKRHYAFARAVEVEAASPDRVEPDCPWFGRCGGCSFRHCRYGAQLRYKHEILAEAFHGVAEAGDIRPFVPAPADCDYRGKMVFSFGTTLEGELRLGLHRRGSYIHIVPGDSCKLQSEGSREAVRRVLEMAKREGLPAFHEIRKTDGLRCLTVRESHARGTRMVELSATRDYPGLAEKLLEALDGLADTVILARDTHLHGPPQADERVFLKGEPYLEEEMNGLRFRIGPDTFFQNNVEQAERMFADLRDIARATGPHGTALDLFSGTGPIALHLAGVAERVVALETWEPSVEAARANAAANGVGNITFCAADVNKPEPGDGLPDRVDLVAVDPPRPGLSPEAVAGILRMAPKHILYVSCNPTTLVRDLKALACGEAPAYRIELIQPYDLFPHTFHMETLVWLSRRAG